MTVPTADSVRSPFPSPMWRKLLPLAAAVMAAVWIAANVGASSADDEGGLWLGVTLLALLIGTPAVLAIRQTWRPGFGQRGAGNDAIPHAAAATRGRPEMPAQPPVESRERAPTSAPDRLTVLVIDDNDTSRFIARSFLESDGHAVVEARDGQSGLAEAARRAFDVVLTDISMQGLDGFQIARRLRDGGGPSAGARILALTAHALQNQRAAVQGCGLDGVLQKPVARADLLRSLRSGAAVASKALEPEALDELEDQLGPRVVGALIRQMLRDGDMIMRQIAALGPEPDLASLGTLAHQFAGAIGTFGAHPLHDLLRRVMQEAREGKRPAADMAALPALWDQTREALEQRVAMLPQTGE